MTKERRLGRGLEALLGQLPGWSGPTPPGQAPAGSQPAGPPYVSPPAGDSSPPPIEDNLRPATIPIRPMDPSLDAVPSPNESSVVADSASKAASPLRLAIAEIRQNPHQPRQDFDAEELQRLAESIKSHGLLQPVVVRPWEEGYQLIAGERRLRAARLAGWLDVPAVIVEADERQTAELAIVENMQRKDLNALEKAASFQRYLDQFGGTQEELASRLDLDRSTIANLIRLLELPGQVQDALRRGKITPGHARALLPLGEEREQIVFCERIQKEGLSVRQTESLVQEAVAESDGGVAGVGGIATSKTPRRSSDHVLALEQEFRAALGTRIKITHDARGRGKVVIAFASHEEFDQIRQHICGGKPTVRKSQAG